MINILDDKLVITIKDASPKERYQWILRSLIAAVRWEGACPNYEKYDDDGQNKIVLAQLMEEMLE